MDTQQNIVQNLFSFFTFLSENSTSNFSDRTYCNIIKTPNSIWPNFTYNVEPSIGALTHLKELLDNKKAPNYIIFYEGQVRVNEDVFTELDFVPLAEWACLEYDSKTKSTEQIQDFEVKKVTTEEELEQWTKVASSGFDQLDYALFQQCFENEQVEFYAGYYQSKMVSSAMLFIDGDTTGIYHVVTLPEYRKKGFGSQLFSHCQDEATKTGAKHVIAQSTQQGLSAWKKIGMKQYGNFYLFCWNKPNQ